MKLIILSLVIPSLLLVSCEKSVPVTEEAKTLENVIKTNVDNGTSVELAVGQKLEVSLSANKSTGYSWHLKPSESVTVVSDSYDAEETKKVGAGGVQKITIEAKRAGSSSLDFTYGRPWEKDAEPAEKFQLIIEVK